MSAKKLGFDKHLEKLIKDVGSRFFAEGANVVADEIAPIASDLLRKGSSEGGKLMNTVKKTRKLK